MKLIWQYTKEYKKLLALNLIAIMTYSITELGSPTIMGKMIDGGMTGGSISDIKNQGIYLILIALIGGIGSITLVITSTKIATRAG